eukprot:scaffold82074_cov69-Phaeocystis_antarctica.AAC.1
MPKHAHSVLRLNDRPYAYPKRQLSDASSLTTYDGSSFQGKLFELEPSVGYEVRVARAVTLRYRCSQVQQTLFKEGGLPCDCAKCCGGIAFP